MSLRAGVARKKLYHGAAFYPELWDEDVISRDIQLMKETGINVVRMGEFAWSVMEPKPDRIDVGFFVNVINRLYQNGIDTIMCTPTATPPIWLTHAHPERMIVDERLTVMSHGSRQHVCTNHPYFRERARLLIEHLAQAVGSLPGVIGWQLDNEFKCHVGECMCSNCKKQWHEWLQHRYETIEGLNDAWGTTIWSEYYQHFDQIPQPVPAPFLHNSSLSTMYRLFSMDKLTEFAAEQAEIIRRYSRAPITHNGSFGFKVDNEKLFNQLDFAAYDTYARYDQYPAYVSNCDFWRNLKPGKDFWVMETSPSFNASLESYGIPHPNGYLIAEAVAAYALGGEAFCYWLWRQQRVGCEQPHGSVISAWGEPTVGYPNVLGVEKARRELEPIFLASRPCQAQAAITYSDRAKAFLMTESHGKLDYRELLGRCHHLLMEQGIYRDLIPEGRDLAGYKLLWTPFMHHVNAEYLGRARTMVEEGGIWIIGPVTGGRTADHTLHTEAALGELEKLAAVQTVFTYPMEGTGAMGKAFNLEAPLTLWSAVFASKGARIMGTVTGGISPGLAFITEHSLGQGKVVMLGSWPSGEAGELMLKRMIEYYACESGVCLWTDVTPGSIVAPRRGPDFDLWVVVNLDGAGGRITLPKDGIDSVTGVKIPAGKLEIGRYEYRAIRL